MCRYIDMPHTYQECKEDVSHVVVHRRYTLCANPQNVSTYRHCDDEHAKPADNAPLFGSSRVPGECPTCKNPAETRIIVNKQLHPD